MTIIQCDFCKENNGYRVQFEVKRSITFPGDFQLHYTYVDICPACLIKRIEVFLQSQPQEIKDKLIRVITDTEEVAA